MKMSPKAEQEVLLFAIMMKVFAMQTEWLEGQFRGEAKQRANHMIATARTTLTCLFKHATPGAEDALDELHDFIYMTVRDAAHVPIEDMAAFRAHVKTFTDKYPTINLNLLQGTNKS